MTATVTRPAASSGIADGPADRGPRRRPRGGTGIDRRGVRAAPASSPTG
jgi:cellobiose transport system permease protein